MIKKCTEKLFERIVVSSSSVEAAAMDITAAVPAFGS